ncbi:hypothetical protein B0H11DRAFT_2258438 [Mycena galericulata]|nr:hypothetical protein B0H11DRAFT_2258438 [Mycena galericulata]
MPRCSLQTELPVSLVFCFDDMEENGSDGLHALVVKAKDAWFMCLNCSIRVRRLTYALHGLVYFKISSTCYAQPSTAASSAAQSPSPTDLIVLMARLVYPACKIVRALYSELN